MWGRDGRRLAFGLVVLDTILQSLRPNFALEKSARVPGVTSRITRYILLLMYLNFRSKVILQLHLALRSHLPPTQIARLQKLHAKRRHAHQAKKRARAADAARKAPTDFEKIAAVEVARASIKAAKATAHAVAEAAAQAQREVRETEEAQEIVSRFMGALCCGGYRITRLERVYNAQLETKYATTAERFRNDPNLSDRGTIMFHGTSMHNVLK